MSLSSDNSEQAITLSNGVDIVFQMRGSSLIITTNEKLSFITRSISEDLVHDHTVTKVTLAFSQTASQRIMPETASDHVQKLSAHLQGGSKREHLPDDVDEIAHTNTETETQSKDVDSVTNAFPAGKRICTYPDGVTMPPKTTAVNEVKVTDLSKTDHLRHIMNICKAPESLRDFINAQEKYPGWTQLHPYELTADGEYVLLNTVARIDSFQVPDGLDVPPLINEFDVVQFLKENKGKLQRMAIANEASLTVRQSETASVASTLTNADSKLSALLASNFQSNFSLTKKKIMIGKRNFFIIPEIQTSPSTGKSVYILICAKQSAKSIDPEHFFMNNKQYVLTVSKRVQTPKKGEAIVEKEKIEIESILSHLHNILTCNA